MTDEDMLDRSPTSPTGSCYSRDSEPNVDISSNNDASSSSSPSPTTTTTECERPKLSFGISQILAEGPVKSRPNNPHDPFPGGRVLNQTETSTSMSSGHPGSRFTYLTAASYSGFFRAGVTFTLPDSSGVIKVPAHRLACSGPGGLMTSHQQGSGALNAMMFPWMHERKDRMTGMNDL